MNLDIRETQGSSISVLEQDIVVRGQVTDAQGVALQGVSILLKGTTTRTFTDVQGRFSISIPEKGILILSSIGYDSKEITVETNNNNLIVKLELSVSSLEEVVVIGYGTVKKNDLTGSVVSLEASDLTAGANINMQQMLQGRTSGVQISQNSGEPGSAMSVKIRGVGSISAGNEPLYVIDGMPLSEGAPVSGSGSFFSSNEPRNPLNSLNPSDIASIEILKDASATAIYGSRGSNGVILITTKKGTTENLKVDYNTVMGFQEVSKTEQNLSAQQYHDILNAIISEGGGLPSLQVAGNFGTGTDWQSYLYQKAYTQSHDLSFSGGANTKYYFSGGYFHQDGILKNSGTTRYTAKVNLDNAVSKKYSVGINIGTSYIKDNYNSSGGGTNEEGGSIYSAINYDPTSPIYLPDNSYYRSPNMNIDNPVALINGELGIGHSYRTFGNAYGEYFLIPSLSAKVRIGGDINSSNKNVWIDPITQSAKPYNGVASILTGTRSYYLGEGIFNFNKTYSQHSINAIGGATYEYFSGSSFSGNARGFTLPDLTYYDIGSGVTTLNGISSSYSENIIVSFLSRVNYSFKDKYLVTLSLRADGSARFGPDNKFGYFPSGAVAWKIQEEPFLKKIDLINELKLRASYGETGNQSIGNYVYIPTFSSSNNTVFNNVVYTSLAPTRKPNPQLKWEAAKQLDLGIDWAILNGRLKGSVEYYNKKTENLLVNLPLPSISGYSSQLQNVGSLKSTGWDLQLNAHIIPTENFNWNLNANVSFNKNQVLSLGSLPNIVSGRDIIAPGLPLQSFYGYEVVGTWQTSDDFSVTKDKVKPGDVKYLDINGDGTINDQDRKVIGNPSPDYTFGITNTFDYKNISLTAYIEGSHGSSMLYASMVDAYFPVSFRRNKLAEPYLNRWTSTNPTNEYPSFVNPVAQGQRLTNSRTVMDASYLRLQSVRLSYDFPLKTKKIMNNLTMYITGQNLFILTDYKGIDPAVNPGGGGLRVDFSSYPYTKTYAFGMNVQF